MPSFTQAPLPYVGPLLPRASDQLPIGKVGRVTHISAAAGYGKTVLLSRWAEKFASPIAWFNPVRLYQPEEVLPGILQAIHRAIGSEAKIEAGKWQDAQHVADEARGLITDFGKEIALVLDGTQFVGGDPRHLQEAFRVMVEQMPDNLAAITTSRNVPIAGAEVARISGRMDLIDQRSLSISRKDVIAALEERGTSREYAQDFAELAEGWPAPIGFALGLPRLPDNLEVLRTSIAHDGMIHYLADSLLERIKPDLKDALLKSAVADVISPEVVKVLDLKENEEAAIFTTYAQGVPVVRVDKTNTFAIHPLFRDQLLERLRRTQPHVENQQRLLYIDYLLKHRDPRAIDQLIAVGDLVRAKDILNDYVQTLIEAGQTPRVRNWFNVLDSQFTDRIEYVRRRLWMTVIEGDIVRVESLLDSFEDEMDQYDSRTADNLAFYYLNRCWVAINVGDIEAVLEYAEKTLALPLDESNPRRDEYLDNARSYIARYRTIINLAGESDPEVRASFMAANRGAVTWRDVQLPAMRSHIAIYRGEINRALALGEQALAAVPEGVKGSVFFPWFGLVGLSGALREQGEAKRAIDLIDEYLEDLLRLRPLVYLIDVLTIRAGALADIGRMSEATDEYGRLRDIIGRYGRGWWINDRLDFQEARFLLRHGDESRAIQLASRLRDTSILPALTLQLDINSAPKRAAQVLSSLKRESPIQEMTFRLFSALLSRDNREQSDQHIKHLLALMEEHGTMRIVVDRGREAVDLISVYVGRNPSRFGENLVARMQDALASAKASGLVSPLSKREQQILGMLASSMTLKQISEGLFVSQNTLKTHLRHLYRKMQVSGRDQAVEQGRKLLLIP